MPNMRPVTRLIVGLILSALGTAAFAQESNAPSGKHLADGPSGQVLHE